MQVTEQKPGSAGGHQKISDVRKQEPECDQKSIIPEFTKPFFQPKKKRYQQDHWYETGIDNFQRFGQKRAAEPLQPDRRIGAPERQVDADKGTVGIRAAQRRNEDTHLFVTV